MQIICISRGTYGGGKQLAEALAGKLGYECLSRETLCDRATDAGIPVGKLEMAMLRRRPLSEQLSIERDRFKAFVAASLCESNPKSAGLVYHGRTGHLPLPGVSHLLRIRAIMDPEMRAGLTMDRLGLTRAKARQYNAQVDEDRRRWVRAIYNVDWDDPGQYDLVVNLSHVNVINAAAGLVALAQLPEFQPTPANLRILGDIGLAARCRLAVADDPRTRQLDVNVKAEHGHVLVTYLPRQAQAAPHIPEILEKIDGVEHLVCTMAATNVLWIQERYDAKSEVLTDILDVAARWDAAVEMMQLSEGSGDATRPAENDEGALPGHPVSGGEEHGGILDDNAPPDELYQDEGVKQTMGRLISEGRAGGYRQIHGGPKDLLNSLDRTTPYSLVVVGDVFLHKGTAVRKRLARELVSYLSDGLRIPVIDAQEIKAHYAFGPKQWLMLLLFGIVTAVSFGLVFSHQLEVQTFLTEPGTAHRILATVCLVLFVPFFAYCFGNFSGHLLKLLKFE